MVISHRNRYLFVELPHTGSSAVAKELVDLYDGERILWKHAYYHDFARHATTDERSYFVFSCIRNPMDEAVSLYLKYKNDHKGNYSRPECWQRNGGWVTNNELRRYTFVHTRGEEFPEFLRKFYLLPYDNWASLDHHRFDSVIRFERLAEDFDRTVRKIGIQPRRVLPTVNPTEGKMEYTSFFTSQVYMRAAWVFGPFMRRWGYNFPAEWGVINYSWSSEVVYAFSSRLRNLYRRYIDSA